MYKRPPILTFLRQTLVVSLLLTLAACTLPAAPAATPTVTPSQRPEAGKLTVVDVYARPAAAAGGNGAAYFTVLNGLDHPMHLQRVQSTIAQAAELHETVNDNGVMKMNPHPDGFEIPADGVLEFKPGGKHVMFVGLKQPLAVGDEFGLGLVFATGQVITLTVPVKALTDSAGGAMPMGSGGMTMPMGTATPAQ